MEQMRVAEQKKARCHFRQRALKFVCGRKACDLFQGLNPGQVPELISLDADVGQVMFRHLLKGTAFGEISLKPRPALVEQACHFTWPLRGPRA
jgi:hypothetical protein